MIRSGKWNILHGTHESDLTRKPSDSERVDKRRFTVATQTNLDVYLEHFRGYLKGYLIKKVAYLFTKNSNIQRGVYSNNNRVSL